MLESALQELSEWLADLVPASENMSMEDAAAEFAKVYELRKRLKETVSEIGRVYQQFTIVFWRRMVGEEVDKFRVPGYSLSASAKGIFQLPPKRDPAKRAACIRALMENPEWGIEVKPGEPVDTDKLTAFCEARLAEGQNPPPLVAQHIIPRVQVRRVK